MTALMNTYSRIDLAFERGIGAYLISADGRRYLDFASGVAVTSLGHSHPHLIEALVEQANKVWHTSNLFRIPSQERLAARLTEVSFADRVFFGNSGAEALECGIKLLRKYHHDYGDSRRCRIIAFEGSFHGRTLATLAAGGNERYLKGYAPALPGFDHVSYGNLQEVRSKIGPETAAILIEPVQGEGGMRAGSVEFLQALRQLCDESGILLMFDEVQCGMGRTGKLFAHEWASIVPDIAAAAKGVGGGFPLSACLATERVAQAFSPGDHGSTFGGNPLATTVGNAVLDVLLERGFLDRVCNVGEYFRRQLEELTARFPSIFSEVRGKGLMRGLRCVIPNADLIDRLRGEGLLAVAAGDNVIRLLPPLVVSETQIDEAMDILRRAATQAHSA